MGKSRTNHALFQDEYALRHKKLEGSENPRRQSRNSTKQWESLIEEDTDNIERKEDSNSSFLGDL